LTQAGTGKQKKLRATNPSKPFLANGWRCRRIEKDRLVPATYAKAVWTLTTLVLPYLGTRPINKITAADVLKVLNRIEGRGLRATAHRTRQRISQVCRYA
jgi:hypothetical protein